MVKYMFQQNPQTQRWEVIECFRQSPGDAWQQTVIDYGSDFADTESLAQTYGYIAHDEGEIDG